MTVDMWVLLFALTVIGLIFFATLLTGSPPMPTSSRALKTMMAVLPQRLPGAPRSHIYELGSGWGGLAVALAKKYPDHTVTGFERSPLPLVYAKIRSFLNKSAHPEFKNKNFLKCDLRDAGLVVCYLMPQTMARLKEKFEAELPDGCLVLCNTFVVPGWTPLDRVRANDFSASEIYLYEMGISQQPPSVHVTSFPDLRSNAD